MKHLVFGTFLLLASSVGALAQEVVGTSMVNGEMVELLSDHSWRYVDGQPQGCERIHARIEFCQETAYWDIQPKPNGEISAMFKHGNREALMFIAEDLGIKDGVTLDFLSKLVVHNAAKGGNVAPEDIPILKTVKTEVFGAPAVTIIYKVNINGLDFVFANTAVALEDFSMQVVTYAVTTTFTPEHEALHLRNVAETRLVTNG